MRPYCSIFLIAAAVLDCGQAGAIADRQPKSCSFADLRAAKAIDEPCTLYTAKIENNVVYRFSFRNGTKVNVEVIDRQGQFEVWKINGSVGMGFETDREHFTGSTMDLKQSMEWEFN